MEILFNLWDQWENQKKKKILNIYLIRTVW